MHEFFEHLGLSDEARAKLEEAHAKSEMIREEFRHAFQRLIEEQNDDQLHTLQTMLRILADQTGSQLASEWLGMVGWQLKVRFNVCITCGVNHDKEFSEDEVRDESAERALSPEYGDEYDVHSEDQPLPNFYELTDEDKKLMEEYHLDDLRIEGTNELVGFVCTGIKGMTGTCGMRYATIEDRMVRDPESCSGCHQRMMHG